MSARRTAILLLFLAGAAGALASATEDRSVTVLLPKWAKGDRIGLVQETTSTRSAEGKQQAKMSASVSVDLEVLEAGPDGFVVRWMSGLPKLTLSDPQQQAMLTRLAEVAAGVGLDLILDTTGTPTGVRNAVEVRETMDRVFAALRLELVGQGVPAAFLDDMLGKLRATYQTEASILGHVVKEAPLYFFPLGWEFEAKAPRDYETEIVSPIGNAVFPSRGRVTLQSIDDERAKVVWSQTIDRERGAEALRALISALAGAAGPSENELAVIDSVVIADSGEFTIDVRTGWIVHLAHERTVRLPGAERVDRTTIRARD